MAEDGYVFYTLLSKSSNWLRVRVRAAHEIEFGLATFNIDEKPPFYNLHIGAKKNTKSSLGYDITKPGEKKNVDEVCTMINNF